MQWAGLPFSTREQGYYQSLFQSLDVPRAGRITGFQAADFLSTSGVDRATLGQIWGIADPAGTGSLGPEGFGVALRLVAHAQAGCVITQGLVPVEPARLPAFAGAAPPPQPQGQSPRGSSPRSRKAVGAVPTQAQLRKYERVFLRTRDADGLVAMPEARELFQRSGLPDGVLARIWSLADASCTGRLTFPEFVAGMHLISAQLLRPLGEPPPTALAPELVQLLGSLRPSPAELAPQGSRSSGSRSASPGPGRLGARSPGHAGFVPEGRQLRKYARLFQRTDADGDGLLTAEEAGELFGRAGIGADTVRKVLDVVDAGRRRRLAFPQFAVGMHLVSSARLGQWDAGGLPPQLQSFMGSLQQSPAELAAEGSSRSASASRSRSVSPAPPPPLPLEPRRASRGSLSCASCGTAEPVESREPSPRSEPLAKEQPAHSENASQDLGAWPSGASRASAEEQATEEDAFEDLGSTKNVNGKMLKAEELSEDEDEEAPQRAAEPLRGSSWGALLPAPATPATGQPRPRSRAARSAPRRLFHGAEEEPAARGPESWRKPATRLGLPLAEAANAADAAGAAAVLQSSSRHARDPHFEARIREILGTAPERAPSSSRPSSALLRSLGCSLPARQASPASPEARAAAAGGPWARTPVRHESGSPVMQQVLMGATPSRTLAPPAGPQPAAAAGSFLSSITPHFRPGEGPGAGAAAARGPSPLPRAAVRSQSALGGALRLQLAALGPSYRGLEHPEDSFAPAATAAAGARELLLLR